MMFLDKLLWLPIICVVTVQCLTVSSATYVEPVTEFDASNVSDGWEIGTATNGDSDNDRERHHQRLMEVIDRWISSFLTQSKNRVNLEGKLSDISSMFNPTIRHYGRHPNVKRQMEDEKRRPMIILRDGNGQRGSNLDFSPSIRTGLVWTPLNRQQLNRWSALKMHNLFRLDKK